MAPHCSGHFHLSGVHFRTLQNNTLFFMVSLDKPRRKFALSDLAGQTKNVLCVNYSTAVMIIRGHHGS